ncbi:DUF6923 family protein [Streptomyces purpureus]|uniref:DUF6923 domain-containing protein n=1 Tax=Streptomyces purpureus TaxID=1951 RepID=A0A918LV10_9ACTN|nr:PQQ-binding-like beta-propeller repeat protein [Streptomyces purpureus]GGT53567.1 hypothetical protein GCM10014713_54310 [Streptomyces purpureus]
MAAKRYNRFTYLAIGDAPTSLYTFDVLTGDVTKTDMPEYNNGYDALAYSWPKGLLYAMSRKEQSTLLVIDPSTKTITPQKVTGLPENNWMLGAVSPDGNKMVICGLPNTKSAVLDLTANPVTATLQNPPGTGGWYDWAYHPVDGRLYAVDGKNGALLWADPTRNPQKVELKENVFPKAQAGSSGFASYSAVFFEEHGRLYAFDNAGNVYRVDLRASTREKPIDSTLIGTAERVGRGKIDVDKLDIRDAGGDVTEQKLPPAYEAIQFEQKPRQENPWEEPINGKPMLVYSFEVTLTAKLTQTGKPVPVKKWRILFDEVPGSVVKTEAAKVTKARQDHRFILDTPGDDHLIAAGKSLKVHLRLYVPKETPLEKPLKLGNLAARRLA